MIRRNQIQFNQEIFFCIYSMLLDSYYSREKQIHRKIQVHPHYRNLEMTVLINHEQ